MNVIISTISRDIVNPSNTQTSVERCENERGLVETKINVGNKIFTASYLFNISGIHQIVLFCSHS